jgi:hypothetical protein
MEFTPQQISHSTIYTSITVISFAPGAHAQDDRFSSSAAHAEHSNLVGNVPGKSLL